ncbi:MAG: ParB N-terminal domain-containing protein [Promicromonosporaceae bacterium]|nr:ParB N-terminal domain-containing protein [Promicromonosporaceae bacterium]
MPTIDIAPHEGAASRSGEYLDVDPATLVLADNIRTDAGIDEEFAADVAEHGVETALTVRRDLVGQLLIIDGQRRYLAATQAGLATVPVRVVDGIGDDEERITRQYRLNEQRRPLSDAEKVAAVEQLALFGRTPKTIARKLGRPEAEVTAALAVAGSKAAKAAIAEPEIDLQTAATLAEFEDDQAVVDELRTVAIESGRGALEHAAAIARLERSVAAAIVAERNRLAAAGVTVLEERPSYSRGKHEMLDNLSAKPKAKNKPPEKALTVDEHAACPGHAMWVRKASWYEVEREGSDATAIAFCMDWKANGHYRRSDEAPAPSGEQAAERALVVAQNKASDAAREVRTRWLREQLTIPKLLPKDAVQHAAAVIASDRGAVSDYGVSQVLDDLLGERMGKHDVVARAGRTPAGGTWYLLALAFAIGEHRIPRDFWRTPAHHAAQHYDDVAARHLVQLAAWGYTLSEIEQTYVDEHTAPTTTGGED